LICGEACAEETESKLNKERRQTIHHVQSMTLRESLLELCRDRKDVKAKIIQRRVQGVLCLFAEEARYHKQSMDQFHQLPTSNVGCTQDMRRLTQAVFDKVCQYIENDDDWQYTMKELMSVAGEN